MNVKSKILSFGLATATMVSMIGATGAVTASAAKNVKDYNVKNVKAYYKNQMIKYNPGESYNKSKFGIKLTWDAVPGAEKYEIIALNKQNGKYSVRKVLGSTKDNYCSIINFIPGGSYSYGIKTYKNGSSSQIVPRTYKFNPVVKMNFRIQNADNTSCAPASLAMMTNYAKNTSYYTTTNVYQTAQNIGIVDYDNTGKQLGISYENIPKLVSALNLNATHGSSYEKTQKAQDSITYLKSVLDTQINNNNPVMICGVFSAAIHTPNVQGAQYLYKDAGHSVVVVGKNYATGSYFIADPYGNTLRTWDGSFIPAEKGLYTSKLTDFSINHPEVDYYYINK